MPSRTSLECIERDTNTFKGEYEKGEWRMNVDEWSLELGECRKWMSQMTFTYKSSVSSKLGRDIIFCIVIVYKVKTFVVYSVSQVHDRKCFIVPKQLSLAHNYSLRSHCTQSRFANDRYSPQNNCDYWGNLLLNSKIHKGLLIIHLYLTILNREMNDNWDKGEST